MASRMGNLPETERARRHDGPRRWHLPNWVIGVLLIVVAIVGPYIAFIDHIPGTDRGYEIEATFANAVNLPSVPAGATVRIAGVDVGEVTSTRREGDNAVVRFTVRDEGRPVHVDAEVTSRPRTFLEGNNFLELDPGSPSAPEMEEGDVIPASRTQASVQLDEVLTALQTPVRADLQVVLDQFGGSLTHRPTPAEDRTQDPRVQGLSAAEALNLAFDSGGRAGRGGARFAEAFRGTEPRDLSRMIDAAGRTFAAFASRDTQLRELVTNWAELTGALAAESENLAATVRDLEPALREQRASLRELNTALPPLRSFARQLTPALAELPGVIAAAEPFIPEARAALSEEEGGGAVRLLRRATPGLAGASQAGIKTIRESNLLSRCSTEVLIPTGDQMLGGRFSTGEPNYREFFYASANIAGESQSYDGNGPLLHLQAGAGDGFAVTQNPNPSQGANDPETGEPLGRDFDRQLWARTDTPPLGTQPQLGPTPPRGDELRDIGNRVDCHTNDPPDLNAGLGQPGPPSPAPAILPGEE